MIFHIVIVALIVSYVSCLNVTFDNRAFILDGQRTLFIGGSIHYPRAHSSEWPNIIRQAKDNGINLIQTYVFWDIHEPKEGEFYFPSDGSSDDVVAFIKECAAQGLYVNLRFGPYVCAEWNYGGFPMWLRGLEDITYRTMNDKFLVKMSAFVDATLNVVTEAHLLASDGGPIVMLQIENEYGNMEHYYPKHGAEYVQWAAEYADSKQVAVPWIMCQQGEDVGSAPPANIINTCNGYYCDEWIEQHAADFPGQPHLWTENWPGWFQLWGEAVPHRPAVDVAFAVARWYARGGSFSNYYMAFGGTTFGRQVGGPLIVTSYDYDVQINEFGMRAEPKFSLLAALHTALHAVAPILLSHDTVPVPVTLNANCDTITYDDSRYSSELGCVAFLSNVGTDASCSFDVFGVSVEVPPWSVSVVTRACATTPGEAQVVLNTRTAAAAISSNQVTARAVPGVELSAFLHYHEPVPATHSPAAVTFSPPDQLTLTQDVSDYLWVSSTLPARSTAGEARLAFSVGDAGGPVCYVYVDGQLAASTIDIPALHRSSNASTPHQGTQSTVYTTDVAFRVSRRAYSTAAAVQGTAVSLTIPVPAGPGSRLDILFASTGVKNYGPYLEKVRVGIVSDTSVDGLALHNYSSIAGLNGEQLRKANTKHTAVSSLLPTAPQDHLFVPATSAVPTGQPLAWYRTTFHTPAAVSAERAYALDLSATALVKGAVWVNDVMLGRYWNVIAGPSGGDCEDAAECTSESYVGGYEASRCRTGCGSLSQTLYKLPAALLHAPDSGVPNTVVFLEEAGGAPEGVRLVEVTMQQQSA